MPSSRAGARPSGTRATWAVCSVVAGLLLWRFWSRTYGERLDFHIYVDAVRKWPTASVYDYRDPLVGLGFTYPPFAAIAIWPLARLSSTLAEHLWLVATVASSLVFFLMAEARLPARPQRRWYPAALVSISLWTVPVVLTVRLGQINGVLALAVLWDLIAARRGSRIAGVATGVATSIKLTPAVALVYFAACRRYDALRNAVLAAAGCTFVALLVAPSESYRYWTSELFDTKRVGDLGDSFNNSLRRLISWLPGPGSLQTLVWLVACGALLVIAFRRARIALDRDNDLAAITIVMCLGAACSPITWSHHLYFLVLAWPLLLGTARSIWRVLVAAMSIPLLIEFGADIGQRPTGTALRAVALVLVVLALPIDTASHESIDLAQPAGTSTSVV